MQLPRLFVGFDAEEALAHAVFAHSVQARSSLPVSITPVMRRQLSAVHSRPRDELASTDFAITRFLVPWLCNYEGWAIFADGDMLCRADICELWSLRDERFSIQVVQHAQKEGVSHKFLGRPQTSYPRKNWSSLMIFNNARCRALTPQYVNRAPGLDLHRFLWLDEAEEIGPLPRQWNHLVGVDAPDAAAKIAHFTLGMPFFHGYNECEFAKDWRAERDAAGAYTGKGDE